MITAVGERRSVWNLVSVVPLIKGLSLRCRKALSMFPLGHCFLSGVCYHILYQKVAPLELAGLLQSP